jgi:hypothetical protein
MANDNSIAGYSLDFLGCCYRGEAKGLQLHSNCYLDLQRQDSLSAFLGNSALEAKIWKILPSAYLPIV